MKSINEAAQAGKPAKGWVLIRTVPRDDIGGWPSFVFPCALPKQGCPSFAGFAKLGTTDPAPVGSLITYDAGTAMLHIARAQ
jgi:hypothetical protein